MTKKFYEQVLQNNSRGSAGAEEMWDARAEKYNAAGNDSHEGFQDRVVAFLEKKGILKGKTVLDVGGGGGRYAIPFAELADKVVMTDISGNMIAHAQNRANQQGLSNIEFVKMPWEKSDLKQAGLENRFDLVFSAMCPATRTPQGLAQMMRASRDSCHINQWILDTDSLQDFLYEKSGLQRAYHPHNDRDAVYGIFNLLWLDGYCPEVNYFDYRAQAEITKAAAKEKYHLLFDKIETETGLTADTLLNQYSEQNSFTITIYRKLAMLHWKVQK